MKTGGEVDAVRESARQPRPHAGRGRRSLCVDGFGNAVPRGRVVSGRRTAGPPCVATRPPGGGRGTRKATTVPGDRDASVSGGARESGRADVQVLARLGRAAGSDRARGPQRRRRRTARQVSLGSERVRACAPDHQCGGHVQERGQGAHAARARRGQRRMTRRDVAVGRLYAAGRRARSEPLHTLAGDVRHAGRRRRRGAWPAARHSLEAGRVQHRACDARVVHDEREHGQQEPERAREARAEHGEDQQGVARGAGLTGRRAPSGATRPPPPAGRT